MYYIDTDLPNIIAGKQKFIDAFTAQTPATATQSTAPDAAAHATHSPASGHVTAPRATHSPDAAPGHYELLPLNALDPQEKEQLCRNILTALRNRGGHWITADIYIQRKHEDPLKEKKFYSFHDAESFFNHMGFKVDKEAKPDYSRLTSLSQLVATAGPQALEDLKRPGRSRLHATWRPIPRR